MIKEIKSLDEQVGAELTKKSNIGESENYPVGYLTVIKNEGKPSEETICYRKHNLLTTDGKAWVHDQLYILASGQTGGANYIGLSNVSGYSPDAADDLAKWTGSGAGEANELNANGLERVIAPNKSYAAGTSKSSSKR